jgi:hypothetical protein
MRSLPQAQRPSQAPGTLKIRAAGTATAEWAGLCPLEEGCYSVGPWLMRIVRCAATIHIIISDGLPASTAGTSLESTETAAVPLGFHMACELLQISIWGDEGLVQAGLPAPGARIAAGSDGAASPSMLLAEWFCFSVDELSMRGSRLLTQGMPAGCGAGWIFWVFRKIRRVAL